MVLWCDVESALVKRTRRGGFDGRASDLRRRVEYWLSERARVVEGIRDADHGCAHKGGDGGEGDLRGSVRVGAWGADKPGLFDLDLGSSVGLSIC